MIDVFIGPTLLAGIGQQLFKYVELFPGAQFLEVDKINQLQPDKRVMIYSIPCEPWFSVMAHIKRISKSVLCMTICETETVHETYGKIFEIFDIVYTPSSFCQRVFSRQFPTTTFRVIHAYVPLPRTIQSTNRLDVPEGKYVFYHIGNILDQRKNVSQIVNSFVKLNLKDSFLVLKATCKQPVNSGHPNIKVINDLQPQVVIDRLHDICDCYVTFSNSEGIGMGAVEAAMRDKPVILPEYGGAPDYIHSEYTISCDLQEVPRDDFLFKKGMMWGKPDVSQLEKYMTECWSSKSRKADHSFTRSVVSRENILKEFFQHEESQTPQEQLR